MEYYFLIVVLAIGCYSAVSAAPPPKEKLQFTFDADHHKQRAENMLDPIFDNFTNFLQDRDPSISVPVKEITTCIEDSGATEILKNFLVEAIFELDDHSDVQNRSELCSKNRQIIAGFMHCVMKAENSPFIDTLVKTADFIIMEFCHSPYLQRLGELFEDGQEGEAIRNKLPEEFRKPINRFIQIIHSGQKPTEKDFCLPIRVAESYEVAAIQSRKFQFEFHGAIGNLAHLVLTINGNYPFKSYEECA